MIDKLISEIKEIVSSQHPSLLPLFNTLAQEARFGRNYIDDDIDKLKANAYILEVGGGIGLLSCQLAKEGFSVVSLEPLSNGFTAFSALQNIVISYARNNNLPFEVIPVCIETFKVKNEFDFSFSINVMEHVEDVALTLNAIRQAMRPDAYYRFTCANYLFPYEHHFNIPILFSKALTKRIFLKHILTHMDNPLEVWDSINWITVQQVKAIVKKIPATSATFNAGTFEKILLRVVNDAEFTARRTLPEKIIVRVIILLKLHKLSKWIPVYVQPTMDCTMRCLDLSKLESIRKKRMQ